MYKRNINIIIQLQHWNKSQREKKTIQKLAIFIQIIAQFTEHWARSIKHLFFFILHFFFLLLFVDPLRYSNSFLQVCVSKCWVPMGHRASRRARKFPFNAGRYRVTPSEICLLHFIFHFSQQGRVLHRSRSICTLFYSTHTNNHLVQIWLNSKYNFRFKHSAYHHHLFRVVFMSQ